MTDRHLRTRVVAIVVTIAAVSTVVVSAMSAGAAPRAEDYDPLAGEPEVAAAQARIDAATEGERSATTGLDEARRVEGETVGRSTTLDETLAGIDAEVAEVSAAEAAALDRHARTRRDYVETAVAAYVAGAPSSLELKASLIEEPVERARSLALAESVGDVFARRAADYDRARATLTDELSDLAETRADAASLAEDARRDLEGARRALADADAAANAARAELAAATTAMDAARDAANARIAAAAEQFRLGGIDLATLRSMGDDRTAVADVPVRAYDAYTNAARTVDAQLPGCRVSWWALAAIGKIETRHGTFGGAVTLPNGDVAPRILGPRLTGGPFAVVTDTDGGQYDGDTVYDRAAGPMQFIPSTWKASGADGNGDGIADPHNYYDAAVAAARYLCRGARGQALDTVEGMRAAALSYNRSQRYANEVLAAARSYGGLGGASVHPPD